MSRVESRSGEKRPQEYLLDPGTPGEPYQPPNGLTGAAFIDCWCNTCERDRAFREDRGDSCPIVADTMIYQPDDPEYPKEWVHDSDGVPICTAYEPEDK
jgi:hypothetical protein